jgi:hypothetical protein
MSWELPDPPRDEDQHSQDCQDYVFIHHAATGGDADCICGLDAKRESEASS